MPQKLRWRTTADKADPCSVLATVHGTALAETANRPALSPLFSRRCFDLYVLLSSEGGGKITALHDRCGSPIPQS